MVVDSNRLRQLETVYSGSQSRKFLHAPWKIIFSELLKRAAAVVPFTIPWTAHTFWGRKMRVYLPEDVSGFIYRYGLFEHDLCCAFCELVKPGSTFFDIGAHFGFFSLLASDLGAKVHAFEPTKSTFSVLSENLKPLGATLNNVAAWHKSGMIEFNDFGVTHSAYNSAFVRTTLNEAGRKYQVPAISIDEYVQQTKAMPNIIKIDAENAEYEILLGMKETIANCHPVISIEVGDSGGSWTSREKLELAISLGYAPMEYKSGRFEPHELRRSYTYANLILFPDR
jgi:FkbM family methyltransferase